MRIENIGRIGVQMYNGIPITRSKEEIKKSLRTIIGIPIVDGHHWIEDDNSSRIIGRVVDAYLQDEVIKGVLELNVSVKGRGFSLGYESRLNDGEWKDIEYNHLAIVDNPRCGGLCKV